MKRRQGFRAFEDTYRFVFDLYRVRLVGPAENVYADMRFLIRPCSRSRSGRGSPGTLRISLSCPGSLHRNPARVVRVGIVLGAEYVRDHASGVELRPLRFQKRFYDGAGGGHDITNRSSRLGQD